jgi:DNA-binding transcriptional regulator YdaS (Cro superfamily)
MIDIVREAAEVVGGIGKLADAIGIARQNLNRWAQVPAERVIPIERATQGRVPRHRIRPDLFGPEAGNVGEAAPAGNDNPQEKVA